MDALTLCVPSASLSGLPRTEELHLLLVLQLRGLKVLLGLLLLLLGLEKLAASSQRVRAQARGVGATSAGTT